MQTCRCGINAPKRGRYSLGTALRRLGSGEQVTGRLTPIALVSVKRQEIGNRHGRAVVRAGRVGGVVYFDVVHRQCQPPVPPVQTAVLQSQQRTLRKEGPECRAVRVVLGDADRATLLRVKCAASEPRRIDPPRVSGSVGDWNVNRSSTPQTRVHILPLPHLAKGVVKPLVPRRYGWIAGRIGIHRLEFRTSHGHRLGSLGQGNRYGVGGLEPREAPQVPCRSFPRHRIVHRHTNEHDAFTLVQVQDGT